jgi:uncharacterized protein (PEP-CTERM system associated)
LRRKPKNNNLINESSLISYSSLFLLSLSGAAYGQEVDVKASVNTTGYVYETQTGENDAKQGESITIQPSLLGSYSSKKLTASVTVNHSIVKNNSDADAEDQSESTSTSQNYTNLKYTSRLDLVKNALSVSFSGAQSYRNISQQQDYFSDQILSPEGLTKTQNNRAQVNFAIPNPSFLGFDLQSTYSTNKTQRSQESETGLDNDNTAVSARLYQGRNFKSINFDITAQYNDSSRTNFQNFESTRVRGNFGFPIYRNINFILTGSLEEYDTGQAAFSGRSNIDTSSYGAGLEWQPSNGRKLSLTYNQLDEEEEQTEFVGVNINWAFSTRTSMNFDYSKRFYGDAYQFGFQHSLKYFRVAASYSEDLTSYSQLSNPVTTITGIFVCEFGSTELTDCFQPESLEYQLEAGEEFRASTETDYDITDEVMFRKTGTASIGYDKRKIKMSIEARYQRTEYLESERLSTNNSLRFNITYALGRKTNLSFVSSISENQFNQDNEPDTILNTSLNFSRTLGQHLSFNTSLRYLDRQSDILQRDGSDKRLTLGVKYTFE